MTIFTMRYIKGQEPMSDVAPPPPKSPIVIIGLLAVVGAALAGIGYIVANW